MSTRRAILLFVRDERDEAKLKPLPLSLRSSGYAALNQAVRARLAPLREQGVAFIVATADRNYVDRNCGGNGEFAIAQRGETFGERISNALADAFELGYGHVAVVGNDCPTMEADDVLAALDLLEDGAGLAAAPARDGGAFIVAARHNGFDRDAFENLPWRTADLFDELIALDGAVGLHILREDFDSWSAPHALRALADLLCLSPSARTEATRQISCFSSGRRKALTRLWLPSPPAFR